jgi:hypothetical protein
MYAGLGPGVITLRVQELHQRALLGFSARVRRRLIQQALGILPPAH